MDWIKKNRDWLITLAVFGAFGILILITSIFFSGNDKQEQPLPTVEEEAKIELPTKELSDAAESLDEVEQHQTTSFFLRPSPDELLSKLENLSHQEFRKETSNLPGLRIMWPAYFFSIVKVENGVAEVMLDASEDGFGVVLLTQIDTVQYPQILGKKQGEKIWLAAEITGVDPTGTGSFLLKTEYVRFDDYRPEPHTPVQQPAETSE